MIIDEEYPQDYFVELENEDFRVGRLSLNKMQESYVMEIDIVQKESMKIWQHVDILFNLPEKDEAIDAGVQRLSNFLKPGSIV